MDLPEYPDLKPTHTNYDTDLVTAVGEFFLACATAETVLLFQLERLQAHPSTPGRLNSMIPLFGMQNKLMLQKIVTATMAIVPERRQEVSKIADKIRTIFEHRNLIAHNVAILGEGKLLRAKELKLTEAGKIGKEGQFTAKQLREYTSKLYRLNRYLSEKLSEWGVVQISKSSEQALQATEHQTPQGDSTKDQEL